MRGTTRRGFGVPAPPSPWSPSPEPALRPHLLSAPGPRGNGDGGTSALTQGLERIPDQLGYLVLSEGAVLASSGDLENDEQAASAISELVSTACGFRLHHSMNVPFKRLSATETSGPDSFHLTLCLTQHTAWPPPAHLEESRPQSLEGHTEGSWVVKRVKRSEESRPPAAPAFPLRSALSAEQKPHSGDQRKEGKKKGE
ncbi:ragulator complex protein LAMTOR4 isoform X1 [Globicephala melas]|uniref:ragulator complex protein LAMTOR4 isoform X1 n=1 Tax=Globicephala melas TaxID=9731 RepID=UPI00293D8AF7|nr:ragulator complex protein LAMTOR4 isoform X1 [Globicephala melas]XP_060141367.1 ragulator complex protein LAMTOR4 isoform X1 [Globicephala melas]